MLVVAARVSNPQVRLAKKTMSFRVPPLILLRMAVDRTNVPQGKIFKEFDIVVTVNYRLKLLEK